MNIFSAIIVTAAVTAGITFQVHAADEASPKPITAAAIAGSKIEVKWETASPARVPQTYPAPGFEQEGVEALFYEGLHYKGKPTRVFAYLGIPKRKGDEKVPGMVLVHGGGGTAYADWVRLWTSRGYAAIAMDTCGNTPSKTEPYRAPHEYGGPHTWGGFEQINQPVEDQWTYQAVGAIILANSLLRSRPEVDSNRIGLTGISWGGYLTCIAAGVDNRFKFAAPVYGCGFIGDNSAWLGFLRDEKAGGPKWLGLWDPARYLKDARMPLLWVTGTNDFAYPLDSLQKSYHLAPGPSTLAIRVRMPHGHFGPGENPEEIHAFANSYLKNGVPLAYIRKQQQSGNVVTVSFKSERPIVRAELNYTKDRGAWTERYWNTIPAQVSMSTKQAQAGLPAGTSVYYINLVDDQGHVVSSEHVEVAP